MAREACPYPGWGLSGGEDPPSLAVVLSKCVGRSGVLIYHLNEISTRARGNPVTKRKEPVRTRNQRACLLATDSPNQPEQKGLSARMVLPLQNALATLLLRAVCVGTRGKLLGVRESSEPSVRASGSFTQPTAGGMIYAAVRAVVLLCVITSSPAAAFQASLSGRPAIAQRASAVVLAETVTDSVPGAVVEDCGCAEEAGGVLMNDVRVTGRTLRDTVLADVNGGRSSVGDVIGADGKAVVVFLRHLG